MLRGDVVHSNYRLGAVAEDLETPSRTTMGSVLSPKLCTSSLISLYPLYVVVGALKGINAVTQRTVSLS